MGRMKHATLAPPSEWGLTYHSIDAVYDLAGNMTDLTYPDGQHIHQTFNGAGQLGLPGQPAIQNVMTGQQYLQTVLYNPDGTPGTTTLGNSIVQTIAENTRLQVGSMSISDPLIGSGGMTYLSHTYCYLHCPSGGVANNGNIWMIADNLNWNHTQQFTYDGLNRITGFSQTGLNQQYASDSFGNISPASGNYGLVYNSSNQVSGSKQVGQLYSPPPVPLYYKAGNETGDTDPNGFPRTFVFDGESRLAEFGPTGGGVSALYTYDATGTRIRKQNHTGTFGPGDTFTEYAYFNGQLIAEKDQTGAWTDYVYANGKKIARLSPSFPALHTHGDRTAAGVNIACGTNWNVFQAAGGGHVIQSGDQMMWNQKDVNAHGGITFLLDDGSYVDTTAVDGAASSTTSTRPACGSPVRRY